MARPHINNLKIFIAALLNVEELIYSRKVRNKLIFFILSLFLDLAHKYLMRISAISIFTVKNTSCALCFVVIYKVALRHNFISRSLLRYKILLCIKSF